MVVSARLAFLFACFGAAAGCAAPSREFVDVRLPERNPDIAGTPAADGPAPDQQRSPQAQPPTYGTGVFVARPTAPAEPGTPSPPEQGGNSFQFQDAPIEAVLSQVLGDAFGVSYFVEPGLQVRLTLRLDGIADGDAAAAALGAALQLQGINVSRTPSGYSISRIQPGASGRFQILASPTDAPSGDAAVLVLHHASADDVVRLAQPLIPAGVIKLHDRATGIVLLQGNPQTVAVAVDALRTFDVDWFQSISSVFVQLEHSAPEELKQELDQIVGRTGGLEVVAVPRIGALYLFARTRDILDRAQALVVQLDRSRRTEVQGGTLVYETRYVSAERLRTVAASLFSGGMQVAPVANGPGAIGGAAQPMNFDQNGSGVAVDEASNLVVVRGSPEDLQHIADLFARIDRPQKQVLIEATIVEVALRDEFRFGVQWDGITDFLDLTFTDSSSGSVASKFPGVSIVYTNTDIQSVLNALDTKTDVEVVSSPRVLALNNQPARIQVGDQVPIVTQSAVSVNDPAAPIVNSTSYRDTGIILQVTPQIRGGDIVEIKVVQEVSDVAETVTSGIDSPTISTRRIEGVLAVPNGSTVALGGLISSNRSVSRTGVPLLMDIPLVGNLFSSTADVTRRSELIVLLRPVVISSELPELDLSRNLSEALYRVRPEWFRDAR